MARFFATTDRGLEKVAAREVEDLLGCKAEPDVGRIFFEADLEAIFKLNLCARTLHKVLLLLVRGQAETLDQIYALARNVDYGDLVKPGQTFAVRAERSGIHNFTSVDVAARVGQAVVDGFAEDTGTRLRANLKEPDVEFLCLVRGEEVLLGLNTTGPSLHRRHYRVYSHPAALKTTIASAMLLISGWNMKEPLLDPMCGGGTIPVEAALMARHVPPGLFRGTAFAFFKLKFLDPEAFWQLRESQLEKVTPDVPPILGVEQFPEYLEGAKRNAVSAGVADTISLLLGDASHLDGMLRAAPRRVVVNPPYGIRLRRGRMDILYRRMLRSLARLAEETGDPITLTVITGARKRFAEAAESLGLEVQERLEVMHGDVQADIFKLQL